MSKPEVSILIPYHEEGIPFILDTIQSIRETIDVTHETIIIDDGSRNPLRDIDGVTVVRQKENLGVGQAFDKGVKEADSDNLFLMGSDIRFIKNGWASKMLMEVDKYPKAFTCSTCVGLNQESPEGMDLEKRVNRSRRNGARILIFHDHKTHPKKPANFRNILEAQWLSVYKGESMDSFEVPCILGAFYGVKKSWYEYCDGWWGHRSWGTLEPTISLKSWLFGGSCRTAPSVRTGHIFKRSGTHGTPAHHLTYNKLLAATLLFEDYDRDRLINFLGHNGQIEMGKKMFYDVQKEVGKKRKEYEKKIVVDIRDWCKRWNVDFREEL